MGHASNNRWGARTDVSAVAATPGRAEPVRQRRWQVVGNARARGGGPAEGLLDRSWLASRGLAQPITERR